MATWSNADGDFYNALGSQACTDGTNIYYVYSGDVYSYTPPSTHTAISTGLALQYPAVFKGDLYALTHDYNNYLRVHKYSGSGTTWNQVLEIASANIESPSRLIVNDTHLLVVVGLDTDPWVTGRHTTDGSTWGTTTFEDGYTSQVTPDYSTQIGNNAGNARTCNHWQGFGDKLPVTQLNGNVARIVQFNGTSEWLTRATISGDNEFVAADQAYYWRETGVADVYEWASTYTGTWTEPATDTIVPISQAGFDVPIGFLRSGSFVYFAYWSSDAADWVDSGESVIGLDTLFDFLDSCIRLNDGTVFVHWSRQAAHGWNVRSETMAADPAPAPTGAEFWSGTTTGGLAKKADLPFDGINNPGCMAVRDTGEVYIGAAAAGSGGELVVKLSPADDFVTPEDITGSLTDPIKGLETI